MPAIVLSTLAAVSPKESSRRPTSAIWIMDAMIPNLAIQINLIHRGLHDSCEWGPRNAADRKRIWSDVS